MINNSSLSILENLEHVRRWRKNNLPYFESPVAYDLIVFLAIQFGNGNSLTVKQLFASQDYSYTAVRQYYKLLLAENLICCVSDKVDGRIKFIEPTDKFINLLSLYTEEVSRRFPPHRPF